MVLFVLFCLFGFLTSSSTTRLYRGRAPRQERLTILRAATHETELGDHDFCLSRSHYTDTDRGNHGVTAKFKLNGLNFKANCAITIHFREDFILNIKGKQKKYSQIFGDTTILR